MNRHSYFEHGADVGVVGRGPRVDAAFCDAARAMFALTTNPDAVRPLERVEVEFEEPEADVALVEWLNGLLAEAHARGLALGRFALQHRDAHWRGEAWGEPWRPGLARGTEVKGATFTMLRVARSGGTWEARCVVDV